MKVNQIDEALDSLMEMVVKLSPVELREVRAAWDELDESKRRRTWLRVKQALRQTRRQPLMDETRERVRAWVNDVPALMGIYNFHAFPGVNLEDPLTAKSEAAPAVLDAAAALIVGDLLDQDDRELLERPVRDRGS